MKNYLSRNRIRQLPILACFLLLLFTIPLQAQNISLTWDSESGCQTYKPDDRKGFQEDIGIGGCVKVCELSTVKYTLTGSNSAWPAVWSVPGGTIQSSSNTSCTVVWGNAGPGSVSVTITTPNGPKTEQVCIEIIEGPYAQFTVFPFSEQDGDYPACVYEEIYFTNMSNDGGGSEIVSYYWDFGDGTYSSAFEPSHSYDHGDDFKVTLTITNACNCTASITKIIHVNDVKAFEISCNSVVCENGTDTYSVPDDIAKQCSQFAWKVYGGTILSPMPYGQSIDVVWDNVDSTGFGYVTFDATACNSPCSSVTIKVPVVQSVGTIVGDAVVCAGEQYRYKLPQWPTTDFVWSIVANGTGATVMNTDQRNEVIVTTGSSGNITLKCTYMNTMLGCGGTAEYNIYVRPMGVITGPQAVCQNTNNTYTLNSGFSGTWTLKRPNNTTVSGTGNTFSHTFTMVGNYSLNVTGTNFCPPDQPFIIRVDKIPATPNAAAIVGPAKICPSTPVEYSMVNTEPGTVLVWSVTNGSFSGSNYGNAVTVTFNPGFSSYTVSVKRENATDPHCPSGTVSKTVVPHTVTPLSITGTPVSNICPNSISGPYNASYLEGDTYEWSVSPSSSGSVIIGQNTPSAQIQWNQTPAAGTQIKVIVRKCDTYYTASLNVSFSTPPTLTITAPSTVCANSPVVATVSGSPTLTSGTISINYGDGSPDDVFPYNGAPTTHYYPLQSSNTNYTITATATGVNGCSTPIVVTKTITVMPTPVAFISPAPDVIFCNTVTPFTLTATVNYGAFGTTTFQWYKDGIALSGQTANNYTVSAFGVYTVYVANSNGCGAYANTVKVINGCSNCTISPPPSITVNATQTACTLVSATASASPAPLSTVWSVGPEANLLSSTSTTANIDYLKAGNHTIIYYATYNAVGGGTCTVLSTKNVIIPFIPKVIYNVQCSSTPGMYDVTLYDQSQYYPPTPATGKTFYVNGTPYPVTPTTTQITVTIPGGNYNFGIELSRATYQTCSYYVGKTLPVIAPVAISGPTSVCSNSAFNFTTNIANAPGISYSWNFGDGTYSGMPSPYKVYSAPGTYTVTVNVSVLGLCTLTDTHVVSVANNGLLGNLTSDSPNCEGSPITITFNNTGTPVSSYTWMKENVVMATTTTPTYSPPNSGNYWVSITNTNGCVKNLPGTNAAYIMSPDPIITGPDSVCAGQSFQLSGYAGAGSLEYRWLRNGTALTTWSSSPILNYTSYITSPATAAFTVEVRVSDGSSGYCVGSASYQVTTYAAPTGLTAYWHIISCNPYKVQLDGVASGAGTYNWSNGMSGQSVVVTEGGPYLLTFTNPGGCTATYQFDVPKDPEVYFWIFPTGCYEFCSEKEENSPFEILGPAPGAVFAGWEWIRDYNVDVAGSGSVPNYTVSQSGTYQMSLDNGTCKKTTDEMNVTMNHCKCDVKYAVKSVKAEYREFCYYVLEIYIDNPYGTAITVNLSGPAGSGTFVPGAVSVPPGGAGFTVQFIPSTFSGGSFELTLTSTNPEGALCKTTQKIAFPDCRLKSREITDETILENRLTVSPNPTRDATGLTYTFANEKAQVRSLEIYSLMGVLLEKYNPETQNGVWNINLGRYAAGQYIVVMKEDGVLIDQKAIIVQ